MNGSERPNRTGIAAGTVAALTSLAGELQDEIQKTIGPAERVREHLEHLEQASARLLKLAGQFPPRLQERIRRIDAVLRKVRRSDGDGPSRTLLTWVATQLQQVDALAHWDWPPRPRARTRPRLGPGLSTDDLILYRYGDLRFAVRGRILYNVREAKPGHRYSVRRGEDELELFPERQGEGPENLLVVEFGEGRRLALRYGQIEEVRRPTPGRFQLEPLRHRHPIVSAWLRVGPRRYLVIGSSLEKPETGSD